MIDEIFENIDLSETIRKEIEALRETKSWNDIGVIIYQMFEDTDIVDKACKKKVEAFQKLVREFQAKKNQSMLKSKRVDEKRKLHKGQGHCPWCGLSTDECKKCYNQIGDRCCKKCDAYMMGEEVKVDEATEPEHEMETVVGPGAKPEGKSRRVFCPNCEDVFYTKRGWTPFVKCPKCGLKIDLVESKVNEKMSPEELAELSDEDILQRHDMLKRIGMVGTKFFEPIGDVRKEIEKRGLEESKHDGLTLDYQRRSAMNMGDCLEDICLNEEDELDIAHGDDRKFYVVRGEETVSGPYNTEDEAHEVINKMEESKVDEDKGFEVGDVIRLGGGTDVDKAKIIDVDKENKILVVKNLNTGEVEEVPVLSINEGTVDHARRELKLAGMFNKDVDGDKTLGDYNIMMAEAVVELMEVFAGQGHSGMSASMVRELFSKLSNFEPLTELTDDPDEWNDITEMQSGTPGWQSQRSPSAFSEDSGKTYWDINEEYYFHTDEDGSRWSGGLSKEEWKNRPMHTSKHFEREE